MLEPRNVTKRFSGIVSAADDSSERLRTLMALPTLEDIFSQLAIEQDAAAISRQIADLILA